MPSTYLERAQDAEAQAGRARNEQERKAFEEIAALWKRLAADATKTTQSPPEPEQT